MDTLNAPERTEPNTPSTGSDKITLALTLGMIALPVAFELVSSARRLFGYLAADAFYYFTIARNIARGHGPSFDQSHPTNGFHPLWQMMLASLHAASDALGGSDETFIMLVVWLNLAMVCTAVFFLALAMRSAHGRISPLFVMLPVGVYGLLLSPSWWNVLPAMPEMYLRDGGGLPLPGTLWSYVNGMESGVLLLGVGATYYVTSQRRGLNTWPSGVGFGVLLACVGLARLDHLFFPIGVLSGLAWLSRQRPGSLRPILLATAVFLAIMGAYLLNNWVTFGSPLPISGSLKSRFPYLAPGNLAMIWKVASEFFATPPHQVYRVTQQALPTLVALVYVARVLPRLSGNRAGSGFRLCMLASALCTVSLGFYYMLFVRFVHQGHWYAPLQVLFVSFACIELTPDSLREWMASRRPRFAIWVGSLCIGTLYFTQLHVHAQYNQRFASFFYDEAPRLRARFSEQPLQLLSKDDGIIAYATGWPTMSAIGLALDPEAARQILRRTLGQLAYQRGYRYLTSLYYVDLTGDLDNPGYVAWLAWRFQFDPRRYRLERVYLSASLPFSIVEMREHSASRLLMRVGSRLR